ncbi:MAG: amidohydrolase family protein [Planctomycetota bacterium]
MWDTISGKHADTLIRKAFEFERYNKDDIVDYHTHIVGIGQNFKQFQLTPPCCPEFNQQFFSWKNPKKRVKALVYLSAMQITDLTNADVQYARRLLEMVKNFPYGKFCIFAMDAYHDETGKINCDRTDLYVPNDYVVKLARYLNDEIGKERFVPVISIHPLREHAVELLECYSNQGVKHVKWLPNAMNFDPAYYTSAPFLKKMAEKGMILLVHTGYEESLTVYDDHQKYGNPMRLRQALNLGVTVVMLHCGGATNKNDVDYPYGSSSEEDQNFMLFKEMMQEEKYKGQLFGEIASLTIPGFQDILFDILKDENLHNRIVNGSDYPLTAINKLKPTKALYKAGYITKEDKKALDEIYSYNPLLFDFVVKRTIKDPDTGKHIPESMFMPIELLKLPMVK